MSYKFQNLTLPENHGFDEKTLNFLETIDKGLAGHSEKSREQFNALWLELEKQKAKPFGKPGATNPKERELNNKWLDSFLRKKDTAAIEMELKAFDEHLNTSNLEDGGILVPSLLLAEIMHVAEENGIARREMRYLPFDGPGNTRKLPIETTGVAVSWIDEGENKPLTGLKLSQITQELRKLACIVVLTEELIEDEAVDLVSYCSRRVGEAIAAEEDSQFFTGVGAPWTGIVNNTDTIAVPMAAGSVLADVSPVDLLNLAFSQTKGGRRNAKYYISSELLMRLMAYRADAVTQNDMRGNFLVISPSQSAPVTLWGYPVVITDALPDSNSGGEVADTPIAFFGDLKRATVYGDKKGVRVKLLDQATITNDEGDSINLAQADMMAVRVHKRVGFATPLPQLISVLQTGPTS
jgi:HK97 family phage major capsid protein